MGAADISITNGTTVVNDATDLGGNNVIVDNSANQNATLQLGSVSIGNSIVLQSGGALVNAGTISRSGPGVSADMGTVTNQAGGSITSTGDNGVYFSLGGTITNNAGAAISGTNGIYGDWPSAQTMTVTNSGTIAGTATSGVDLENGGTITNQAGGKITGADYGVLTWGGTVTNTGAGSLITGTANAGVNLADVSSLINTDGAKISGYEGVQAFNGSSVTNSGGATITGHQSAVYTANGASTVINTGAGSTISSDWWGVYLNDGGVLRNENGATIVATGSAAVYLRNAGEVINGAGSNITGSTTNAVYGIYGSGGSVTVSNAGTITGDVRLSDYFANQATLFTGGKINGDLYINTDPTSTLTLDGTGTQLLSEAVTGQITFVNGVLTKQGSGTWVIDKSINAFTMAMDPGSIVIDAGTFQIGNGNSGSTAGRITANVTNNGTLAFYRSDNLTYAGVVSGTGNLIKYGAGKLTLTGNNTYGGGTIIAAGTLQIGNGGTVGSITGDVANYGTLTFDRSNAIAFGGAVSGTGALVKSGAGTLTLTGNSSFTGGTTINAGTLQIGNGGTAGSIAGRVTNNGTLTFNCSDALAFDGSISGTGRVTQTGAGTTTLSGINTYSGGTTISGGTLIGSTSSFGTGAIANNGTLVIDQAANGIFINALSGAGTFIKRGAGSLSFTGTSAITSTDVEAGRFAVDGSLAQSLVTVKSGATLGGNGTVGGIVAQGGAIIAPGNSIGTLNVVGNYSAAAGSIYQVELSGNGTSDLISATGTATIAPGALLQAVSYGGQPFAIGTRYTVLSGATGRSGSYSLVNNGALTAFLSVTADYDANNAYLQIVQSRAFVSAAATPNQTAVSTALQTQSANNGLFNAMLSLPTDAAARNAFDLISGEAHASIQTAFVEDSRFPREAALNRLRASLGGIAASNAPVAVMDGNGAYASVAPTTERFAFWAQSFGSWGHWNSDGNAARLDRNIGGLIIGADGSVFDTWRLGAFAGLSSTSFGVDTRNSSGSNSDYHVGLYGGSTWGSVAFRFGVAYAWHDLSMTRNVALPGFADTLRASYSAGTAQAFGEFAYGLRAGAVAVEPFANLAHVSVRADDFTESGGAAALTGADSVLDVTFTTLGLRASTDFTVGSFNATARGSFGWRHAFGDMAPLANVSFAGGDPFAVMGTPIAQDVAAIDLGLDLDLSQNAVLGISYGSYSGSGMSVRTVRTQFSVAF